MNAEKAPKPRALLPFFLGIGAASAAAHVGNNFTTYLVGGLIDRFGFTPIQMGAWSMVETLAYAAAMFLVAPRVASISPRALALAASILVVAAQCASSLTGAYPLLMVGRIAAGFGFGLLNTAVNLSAARMDYPARAISAGLALQTLLFAFVNLGLPMIGRDHGVAGMFLALGGLSLVLGLGALMLPSGAITKADDAGEARAIAAKPIGADGTRVLAAMALFAFGSLAIWPFMERAAHAIAIDAVTFGQFVSIATILSAGSNLILAIVASRLKRSWPLAFALIACGTACALLTTVQTPFAFAAAISLYQVTWFMTYPLILGVGFAVDPSGRLAVMTTGTWLLAQSLGSLGAGIIAQAYDGYTAIGPIGLVFCVAAIFVVWPLTRRIDRGLSLANPA